MRLQHGDIELVVGVLLVQQRDGRTQIQSQRRGVIHPPHAVQRIPVAYQDAQRPAVGRGRYFDRQPAHDSFTAIGPQHCLHLNFVARTSFGDRRARRFQPRRSPLVGQADFQIQAHDLRLRYRIAENAGEAFTQHQCRAEGRRRAVLRGRKHVLHRHIGIAVNVDLALHAIRCFRGKFVGSLQRAEDRRSHRQRREPRIAEHPEVVLARLRAAMHRDGHRNHFWLGVELPQNAGMAVLHECAHRLCRVDDLERVHWRGQRGHDLCLAHGHVHGAKLQHRMAASQQVLGIHVSHRAGGGDVHIAFHQRHADGRARLQRFRLLVVAHRACACHRHNTGSGKLRRKRAQRLRRKSCEYQRSIDWLDQLPRIETLGHSRA